MARRNQCLIISRIFTGVIAIADTNNDLLVDSMTRISGALHCTRLIITNRSSIDTRYCMK